MKLICTKCNRIVEISNWDSRATCKNCGGYFQPLNSSYNLTNQFQQIGQDFSNIPHVTIGKEGFRVNKTNQPIQNPYNPQNMPYNQPQNRNLPYPEDNLYEKIRKYAFWIMISLVSGYAIWRIVDFMFLS